MKRYEPRNNEAPVDETRCMQSMNRGGPWYLRQEQCRRKRKPGTEWCGQHGPEVEAARQNKRQAKYDRDRLVAKLKVAKREAWDAARELIKAREDGQGVLAALIKLTKIVRRGERLIKKLGE